ncbi:hypothetical protein [uncultured Massilia sp.]|uniref:hypothetical protein n=1 Tax=uncultured Massilia sp. TaxID=169973 RepID=UPI002587A009|nr:hypothetical protein [uncultured Massilia sp.]
MTNTPRAFDFGEDEAAPPSQGGPPKAFSFDDLPPVTAGASATAKAGPAPLFDSDDHPAVRDALSFARADYPQLVAQAEQRLAALFRRLLPVRLGLVTEWAEAPLREQAALLQPITELVLMFTRMAVPAQLEAALACSKPPEGMFGKLFRRQLPLAQHKALLTASREGLVKLLADSEGATRNLEESAQNLSLHAAALAVVAKLAGGAMDATLSDAITQRRTLIQQAVRQAELSIMQMGQVRQQAADLIGQISSFLTVTLPALEMAQAQGGN